MATAAERRRLAEMKRHDAVETVAIVPAYNEERFIGSVVLAARRFVDAVIVVDDGSDDATAELAEAAGAIVLRHDENTGKAGAVNTAFRQALALEPKAVVLLDGDGQHLPAEIPNVLRPVLDGEADMVVGSRYIASEEDIPSERRVGHRLVTWLTNLASGVWVSDSQSGYRAFSTRALQELVFLSKGFSLESEMQFLASAYKLRTLEVPIRAIYADPPKRSAIRQGLGVLNGILRMIGQHRPLLFFGAAGLVTLVLGLLLGTLVIDIYSKTRQLAVGYAMITVLLVVIGTSSLFTGLLLHSVRAILLDLRTELRATRT